RLSTVNAVGNALRGVPGEVGNATEGVPYSARDARMSQHEAFLKAMRVEPNDPFHVRIYCDFLRDEGYDPEQVLPTARLLAEHLHSANQALSLPRFSQIGRFGVAVLVSCTHLTALREIYLPGRVVTWSAARRPAMVEPNIGQAGVILLAGSPLLEQIRCLD